MALGRTANPALTDKSFVAFRGTAVADRAMTIEGTVRKTAVLLFLCVASAAWTWHLERTAPSPAAAVPWIIGGAVGGFIVALITIDFDFIENAARQRVPKYMEWYGAFGLMVTLIWLYLEILRLLVKLRGRR